MQKRESLFKYKSHVYNVQGNSDVNHGGIKKRCNKTLFTSLSFINGKTYPHGSSCFLRNYNFWSDPKLCPGIFAIRRIPRSGHACTTILYLSWDSKTKALVNQTRYGRVYNCKYSQTIGFNNNWIIFKCLVMEQTKKITNKRIKLFLMVM